VVLWHPTAAERYAQMIHQFHYQFDDGWVNTKETCVVHGTNLSGSQGKVSRKKITDGLPQMAIG
jgi:hypothetical protein